MGQKNILITVIIVLVLVGGVLLAWYFIPEDDTTNTNTVTNTVTNSTTTNTIAKVVPAKNTIWVMDGSFSPSVVTIKVGDTVTWVNKDAIDRQVSSDPHPSHTALAALESDALSTGDEYTFQFDEAGTWFFHDHLNPIQKGTVIVE